MGRARAHEIHDGAFYFRRFPQTLQDSAREPETPPQNCRALERGFGAAGSTGGSRGSGRFLRGGPGWCRGWRALRSIGARSLRSGCEMRTLSHFSLTAFCRPRMSWMARLFIWHGGARPGCVDGDGQGGHGAEHDDRPPLTERFGRGRGDRANERGTLEQPETHAPRRASFVIRRCPVARALRAARPPPCRARSPVGPCAKSDRRRCVGRGRGRDPCPGGAYPTA